MTAPLDGIKVLDLSRVLAGPWTGMTLADLGADVIKIENPKGGDDTRLYMPPDVAGESGYYLSCNRSKKSVALDFSKPEGQEIVKQLALWADILIENYRFGNMERYGLGYEALSKLNPRLIYCSISGYGRKSPAAKQAGYDTIIQAESGIMSVTGEQGGDPVKVGVSISDLLAGMNATQAILAALIARDRDDRGQHLDISLLDCSVNALAFHGANFFISNKVPQRYGTKHPNLVPCQAFDTADGKLALVIGNDRQFQKLCDAMDLSDLAADPLFKENKGRVENRSSLVPVLESAFREASTDYWVELLRAGGLPVGAIRDIKDVLAAPEIIARGMIQEIEHPTAGTIRLIGSPLNFSETPTATPTHPPLLGEHTDDVLRDVVGVSKSQISKLRRDAVIGGTSTKAKVNM